MAESLPQDVQMFAVSPITTCPHFSEENFQGLITKLEEKQQEIFKSSCTDCNNTTENWICCTCQGIFCSRYVNSHMMKHNESTQHPVALSFSDLSYWCYTCDSYITNTQLNILRKKYSDVKFKDSTPEELIQNLTNQLAQTSIEEQKEQKPDQNQKKKKEEVKKDEEPPFTYDDFIEGLKTKKFKKICFLTGAGVSVAAGIPDFRTPGTGLYYKLQQYNLKYPEQIFEIPYFKEKPTAFYQLCQEFFTAQVKPTLAHYLQTLLNENEQLLHVFTQNIDSLELDAGLPKKKLLRAHGHMDSAHCVECKKEGSMEEFKKGMQNLEVQKCAHCEGLIKPDIVFFGENLPPEFFLSVSLLEQCDLAIIMGTSLVVQPFASLIDLVSEKTPMVLINRENSVSIDKKNFLFLDGDIEKRCEEIIHKLEFSQKLEELKQKTTTQQKK